MVKAIKMKNISSWIKRHVASTALIGVLSGFSVHAAADSYNVILKQNGSPLACATGGFQYTKDGSTGWQTPTAPSVNLAANCITDVPAALFNPGALKVIIQNVTLNKQAQGLNVVGLGNGLISSATGSGANHVYYNLVFTYAGPYKTATRNYTIMKVQGTAALGQTRTVIASGTYHVQNVNAVPEPESLLLLLAGAAGLFYVRRRKQARHA